MLVRPGALAVVLVAAALSGCLNASDLAPAEAPPVAYAPRAPDLDLSLLEHAHLVPVPVGDVAIHVRIVRPDVDGPVPVIVQFTPYTAPGRGMAFEPLIGPPAGRFVDEFVRRGFAFAFADVRGTGDSGGCLDLRGALDIEDAWHLTEFLGTQEWSNGKVGFIGASYPGSEAHIAAIAGNPHLGGVVPVVASTSFYNYHHKGGVPYSNHIGTNTGYTQSAYGPTKNPQYGNWAERQAREPVECDTADHNLMQLDQSGEYNPWWRERDLRWRVDQVKVPVLMAQGLADWNVKPDHVATWFNDLDAPKTLIAGQWAHQFPEDAPDAYGPWWELATAFFDETLRGVPTGRFTEDRAYVQASDGAWHVYAGAWPPLDAEWTPLNLTASGLSWTDAPSGTVSWNAKPLVAESGLAPGADEQVVLALGKLDRALRVSGVPRLDLTVTSTAENVHLVAILEVIVNGAAERENHGYLNPIYRAGLDKPQKVVPGKPTLVTIDMYPQEDVFPAGAELRLVLRSVDPGRTIPVFDEAVLTAHLDGELPATLWLPLAPA